MLRQSWDGGVGGGIIGVKENCFGTCYTVVAELLVGIHCVSGYSVDSSQANSAQHLLWAVTREGDTRKARASHHFSPVVCGHSFVFLRGEKLGQLLRKKHQWFEDTLSYKYHHIKSSVDGLYPLSELKQSFSVCLSGALTGDTKACESLALPRS